MPRFSILESSKYLHLTNTDADDACRLLRLYEPAYVVSWVHSHPFPLYVSYFIHEAFHIARFLKIYTDLYTELSFVFYCVMEPAVDRPSRTRVNFQYGGRRRA